MLQGLSSAAQVGFEVRDVESLREHYILTLEHWVRRLEANHDRMLELADEVRYRIFRIYMAGAALGFTSREGCPARTGEEWRGSRCVRATEGYSSGRKKMATLMPNPITHRIERSVGRLPI